MNKLIVSKSDPNKKCTKASRANNKINKLDLEKMLNDPEIMGKDVKTLKDAKKIKYKDACRILIKKNVLEEIEVQTENKVLDCNKLTFEDLKKIAQSHNISYVGDKKKICKRLEKIGYTFTNSNLSSSNTKCYQEKKKDCNTNINCQWMPQIIDKNKRFSKDLLISRLEVIDKLNNRQV